MGPPACACRQQSWVHSGLHCTNLLNGWKATKRGHTEFAYGGTLHQHGFLRIRSWQLFCGLSDQNGLRLVGLSLCWGPNQAPVHSKRAPKIFGLSRHETSKPAAWIWRFKARRWEIFPTAANSLLNLFSLRPNTLTSAFHSVEMATQVLSVLQTGKTCSAESMPFPTSEREQPVLQDDSRLHRQDDRAYGHRPYINRLHQCTLDCYEQDAWF